MKGPALIRIGLIWHYRFQRDGVRIQRSTHETDWNRASQVAWDAYGGRQTVPTLATLAESWGDVHKPIVSGGHRRSVDVFRRRHLYGLGDVRIDRIRTDDVEAARAKHLVGHTPDTTNHWLRIMKLLFGWAVKRGLIPAVPWKVKSLKVQKKPRVILPVAKAAAFLAAVDQAAGKRTGIGTAIRLMLGLGLRESEALSARWEWIDWERSIYTPGITKGREAVTLPMPGWLVDHLEPLRGPHGLIVHSPAGKPYGPGSTRSVILRANAAAGVPGLSPHRLRGTFATLLSEGGTPVQTIQRMLRHKDVKTTVGYCEIDMTRVVAVQEAIAEKMGFKRREHGEVRDGGLHE